MPSFMLVIAMPDTVHDRSSTAQKQAKSLPLIDAVLKKFIAGYILITPYEDSPAMPKTGAAMLSPYRVYDAR